MAYPLKEKYINLLTDHNSSTVEQDGYQSSLKYGRDLNNVVRHLEKRTEKKERKPKEERSRDRS